MPPSLHNPVIPQKLDALFADGKAFRGVGFAGSVTLGIGKNALCPCGGKTDCHTENFASVFVDFTAFSVIVEYSTRKIPPIHGWIPVVHESVPRVRRRIPPLKSGNIRCSSRYFSPSQIQFSAYSVFPPKQSPRCG